MIMFGLIGSASLLAGNWADDDDDEFKKSGKFEDAMAATFSGLVAKTINNSSLDFIWWKSIFEPAMDWNPFSVMYLGKEIEAIGNLIMGDKDFSQTLTTSFSAAR